MKDQFLQALAKKLNKPLYIVGGTCRDFLAGLPESGDVDICAAVDAGELADAAKELGFDVRAVYKNTGTVKIGNGRQSYEYTRFRSDGYTRGTHRPDFVTFTEDIAVDARRRDFKCNAVYYDVLADKFVDPLGGIEDIKKKIINTVVSAKKVFGEDGLRLMRLCRIAAQIGFEPTKECLAGARENVKLLRDIAAERVWAELDYILHADDKYGIVGGQLRGLSLLSDIGALKIILPELALGEGMSQRSDYHAHDVLTHSLLAAAYAQDGVRLAALLHDVGKPYCKINNGNFTGHETEGARIAGGIFDRLRVPKKLAVRCCRLIKWHMYDLNGETRVSKIRRFAVENADIWDDLLKLKQADYSACKDDLGKAPVVAKWEKIMAEMKADGAPLCVKELKIRGDELIKAGVEQGKVGKILHALLAECAVNPALNRRETLIKLALSQNFAQ